MKHLMSRVLVYLLVIVLLTGLAGVTAVGTDFLDVDSHWAKDTLLQAVSDGYLQGADNLLRPDAAITGAELITVLTRVFSAKMAADLSKVTDIVMDNWYYDAAAKAVFMGILSPVDGQLRLDEAITRKRAFLMISNAFQLVSAGQDTAILSQYDDGRQLTGEYRQAAAALAEGGYVKGYAGQLHIDAKMTRAEFMTVLYGIISNQQTPNVPYGTTVEGGTMLSGSASLSNAKYTGSIYFDCSATDISLESTKAVTAVIRSDKLDSLYISFSTINRLVLATGSGDLSLYPDLSARIQTIAVGDGEGRIVLGGNLHDVEITGDNRTVLLNAPVDKLSISGSGNTVIVSSGITVADLKLLSTGTDNIIKLDGSALSCAVYGSNNAFSGSGKIQSLTDNAPNSDIPVTIGSKTVNEDYGLNGVELALTAPDSLPPNQKLEASVTVTAPFSGKTCRGIWYLDGSYIAGADINLDTAATTPAGVTSVLSLDIPRTSDIPVSANLSFVLSLIDADGVWHEVRTEKAITIEPQPKYDAQAVLKAVTTGYKGNYTLAWAEAHDYDTALKENWVNLKEYTSKSSYLVWVSIAYQRVNIFSGSAGNWKLEKTFIIGSGAVGKDTPTGVFTVIGRNTKGWTTKQYTVKPVINFYSAAYGFHSRLYSPNTTKLIDARIGYPVSHGCIRMYDEDVAWMYDNIPTKTTVVVY